MIGVAALVVVERVLADLLGGPVPVVRGVHRGGRADGIHEPDREERGRRRAPTEDRAVEVGQRLERGLHPVTMDAQIAGDLGVWIAVGQPERTRQIAQERHVRHDRREVVDETADRDRQPAALAPAGHRDPAGIDGRMLANGLHGTDGVGDHAPVVVRPRVEDAAGHEPGMGRRPRAVRVGRVADHPGRTLAARIHDEMGEPGGRPADALMGESPAAAIADVLDDPGSGSVAAAGRCSQPRTGEPPNPANVTSKDRMTVSPLSTGVKVAGDACDRVSRSVSSQNASRSAGTARFGR